MALEFGGKQKAEQQFREELRVLATQIEAINQQLSDGTAAGGAGGPALARAFSDINSKLQYLYELMKSFQTDVKEEVKGSIAQTQKLLNQTLQKDLADIYEVQKSMQQSMAALEQRVEKSPALSGDELSDMRATLKELVAIYREEVGIFRSQNEFLQRKLLAIEKRLEERK